MGLSFLNNGHGSTVAANLLEFTALGE